MRNTLHNAKALMSLREVTGASSIPSVVVVFFFFQAEDGIRDIGVTGVQTCALPISPALTAGCCEGRIPSPTAPGKRGRRARARSSGTRRGGPRGARAPRPPAPRRRERAARRGAGGGWRRRSALLDYGRGSRRPGLYNAHLAVAHAHDIAEALDRIAPSSLCEDWDNCGLQVGDPAAEASRVLLALTPLDEGFEEAEVRGADFLLFHHPLLFGALKSVDTGSYPGDLVSRAIRRDLTVYAAHTSYDAAPGGVSVALVETLGLQGPFEVVSPRGELRKLVVFVPEENADALADALSAEGTGVIGEYTHCTFRTPGTGTFLGGEATDPYIGEKGRLERVEEIRLETVVPAHAARRAAAAAVAAHPYEEAALDLYPIEGYPEGCGYGRVGTLPRPMTPEELAGHVE